MDWKTISKEVAEWSDEFIQEHKDKLDWDVISQRKGLSEQFMERYAYELNWGFLSSKQVLLEPFIEKHIEKVYWSFISTHQILSESFIEKHTEVVNWDMISECQQLSFSFCERNTRQISLFYLKMNTECSFTEKEWNRLEELRLDVLELEPDFERKKRTISLKKRMQGLRNLNEWKINKRGETNGLEENFKRSIIK